MNAQHIEDERLMGLLETDSQEQPDVELEEHLRSCTSCTGLLASYRILVGAMKQPEVWEADDVGPLPDPARVDNVVSFSRRLHNEEAAAEQWLRKWEGLPIDMWSEVLCARPEVRTVGMVRKLLERSEGSYTKSPMQALLLTEVAVTLSERVNPVAYPGETVIKARGDAWREKAYALSFVGRYHDALSAVGRCEELFQNTATAEHDLARAGLVKALILRGLDEVTKAIDLCRSTAPVFVRYGDVRRGRYARWIEAMMLYKIGRTREALEILTHLEREFTLAGDSATADLADTLHNIAACHTDLGDFERSSEYALSAVQLYQILGMVVGQIRSRWILAQSQMARGFWNEALSLLSRVRQEFDAVSMEQEANGVCLEIAEIMLVLGRADEVVLLCRELLQRYERSGLSHTWRAVTALGYLQEAAMRGAATPAKVRHVRDYIRRLPSEPQLLFLDPPG